MSTGRTIALSDVHGCHVALETLLAALDVQPDDCLIQLGDIIDRGPDTRRCIELFLELRQTCRLIHLMGNHEEMLLSALYDGNWSQSWLTYGGREMLASYGGGFESIPMTHLDFLRSGKDFFETQTEIFVHGNLRPQVPVDQEQAEWLRWARFQPTNQSHCSGKRVICGHTAQSDGRPVGGPHYLCLDTCAYCPQGYITALDVQTDTCWQAAQDGRTRGPVPLAKIIKP